MPILAGYSKSITRSDKSVLFSIYHITFPLARLPCLVSGAANLLTFQIQELNNLTDQRIFNAFRTKDQQAGFWLIDDPGLSTILAWIRSH